MPENRRLLPALLFIALALRLAWGFYVLSLRGPEFIFTGLPDSAGYHLLARSFLGLPIDPAAAYSLPHLAFWRTPGQPLYQALAITAGGAPALIVMNALIGALTVLIVFFAGRELSPGNPLPGRLAAVMAAVSPTAISLVPTGLTEIPFQAAMWGAFYLLISGARRGSDGRLGWSGVALAVAAVFRPSAQFLPLLWPAVGWLLGRHFGVAPRWRATVLAALVPLVFIAAWTARNGLYNGVWTYSGIGPYDLDRYVGIRVFRDLHPDLDRAEAEKQYGMDWSGPDKRSLWEGRKPAEVYRFHQERVRRLTREHPVRFAAAFATIAGANLFAPAKLPFEQAPPLEPVGRAWVALHRTLIAALVGLDLFALVLLVRRGQWPLAAMLAGCVAYFIGLSGVLYFQGSRLSYPAAPAMSYLAGLIGKQKKL